MTKEELLKIRQTKKEEKAYTVFVCSGASCISSHSLDVKAALLKSIEEKKLKGKVSIVETGCMGPCQEGPLMFVRPEDIYYVRLKAEDVDEIVKSHFGEGLIVERLLWGEEKAFFEKQKKIVLSNCGRIDPEDIEAYIREGGYSALLKVLEEYTPEGVIEELTKSGLKGRGGAGFPTGLKWRFARNSKGEEKYIICNADEGDPGAFMDRAVLEGDPHAVIEGMAIGAYAIGAKKGFIYVRAEYPLAIKRLEVAIEQARKYGLLGKDIFGKGFDFDLEIRMGAGAFVCGEETALIASIEGKRGMPRPRPPFPAERGLWGKPTVINNVETFANIRHIILNGSSFFSAIGIGESKGTKIFALSGKVKNTGLVEVPMGITLGEIVFDIGGGIPKGKKFKAVQTGGPSGGCIPPSLLNLPVAYETLKEAGAIMGSGGMIVLDEDNCMVNMAKYFVEFTMSESCGQCTPCRVGLKHLYDILDRITKGKAKIEDLERLERIAIEVRDSSLCGLGQTAPNPILSTLQYFREEYEEHIKKRRCRASVCAALFYAPCSNTCPAGVDVSRYVAHVAEGELDKAFFCHMENNPFPASCARVCPAFCETKCERGKLDEPVSIREIKRIFADYALEKGLSFEPPTKLKKEKIAIVGGGPAGLSAAFYLTRLGYRPTLFEASESLGGMMMYGIPPYRLPRRILEAEIERVIKAGVEIRLRTPVKSLEALKQNGFDAIFLSIGANESQRLGVKGEDLEGIFGGVEFLRGVAEGKRWDLRGKEVLVVGGGSTAMDVARVALRFGAKSVRVAYRRTEEEMPAQKIEVKEAEEEGVEFLFLTNPIGFSKNGRIEVRFVKMGLKGFDSMGRRRPYPIEGSDFSIRFDYVFLAIGQRPRTSGFEKELDLRKDGTVEVDQETLMSSKEGVFAGGDCVLGPATVVEAVSQGRQAALSIDRFLGYSGELPFPERQEVRTTYNEEEFLKETKRVVPRIKGVKDRVCSLFEEVNEGLDYDSCLFEAKRCLHCDRGKKIEK